MLTLCALLIGVVLTGSQVSGEVTASEDYSITTWQTEDGLPSDTIFSVAQTPDGFLWVGTSTGLTRFDGVQFRGVPGAKGLANERIAKLFVDRAGGLWISAKSGRLAYYAGQRFKLLEANTGWPRQPVNSFAQDRDGSVALTTEAGGIFRFANDHFLPIRAEEDTEALAPAELAVDGWGDQSLWIRSGNAVGLVRGQTWRKTTPVKGLMPGQLGPMVPRRAGGIWMFTAERNLELLGNASWPVETRLYPDFMEPNVLLEDSTGNLWFGTTRQGLGRLAGDGGVARFYIGSGFPTDAIYCLFEDLEGNIWVGGKRSGLIRIARRKFSTFRELRGIKDAAPLSLSQDKQGALWVGFGERGIYRLDRGKLTGPVEIAGHSMQCTVWAMLAGGEDRMWFGAYGIGVFLAQGSAGQLWTKKDGLPSTDLQSFHEEPGGALWIGTERGLCLFDGASFVNVTERDGLPQAEARALAKDRFGNLWVGTSTGELVQWRDRKVTVFSSTNGLPGNGIQTLLADPDGSLWIGTMGGGLCWRRNERFFRFDAGAGMPVDSIVGIVDDRLGYLWLASNRRVLRVARGDLEAVADGRQARLRVNSFDQSDGLPSSRVSMANPCAVRLEDGRLCFATLGGVAVVNPRELRFEGSMPKVVVEEVLVDGQPARSSNPGGRVIVSRGARRIEFRYTAPSLSAPEHLRFQYRIKGLEDEWQEAGIERTASYGGLRPGDYEFEVTATIEPGGEQAQSASLIFEVEPQFWETTWFRAGAILGLVLLVGMFFRLRMRVLERKRAAQVHFSHELMEQQEAERKRIAAELHDSLGQSLSIIQNHAVLAGSQGDANGHVAGISQAATEALASVREICHALRPVELDRLGLSKTLRAMAERLAVSSGLQIDAEIDPIDSLIATDDWIHVLRFVQEAFNNVVKHARATQLKITLREDEHCLHLVIADDGRGFDPTAASGHSLGLSTMEERARILRGDLRLESVSGNGTTLRLDLPVTATRQSAKV